MKQGTLNRISLIVVLGALVISAAATAQNSFGADTGPQPRGGNGRAQPAPPPVNRYDLDDGSNGGDGPVGIDGGGGEAPYRDDRRSRQAPSAGDRDGRSAAPPIAASETQDFGVAATDRLRPSDQTHGPTPSRIPGGMVVTTGALQKLLSDRQSGVIVLDVFGAPQMLPNAVHALPAAQGGSFDDPTQTGYGQFLQQITGGDRNRPIVTYCAGVQCWLSYNAALRAIRLGYSNVLWYRGGLEAWTQAGLPTARPPQQPSPSGGDDGRGQERPGPSPRAPAQLGQRDGY
ncbi:MAG: hypothetical protein C0434_16850 [Xanthomonadaceae bacterium]|nr:hypothetical protein [Xanthomonadaceae bacterium]